jgi:hypothetical protein
MVDTMRSIKCEFIIENILEIELNSSYRSNSMSKLVRSNLSTYSFKATLIKHQYTKTPRSAVMYVRKAWVMMLLD